MRNILIVTAACAGLMACQSGERTVAGICKPFPEAQPAATDGAGALEDCLHRWGYTLAAGRDDAGTVADATVAACTAPLTRWNQQSLTAAAATPEQAQEGLSLLTGQPSSPIAEHRTFAADRALFYVAQARAGACKAPPRRDGAPMTAPEK
ncbi:MAG: hypothetical protein KKE02_20955 [Alphaproteobacteria bacterium]|nr:hypothetical protein [Alphaproteobacteria bacterium]MBU1514495.1 hypothetical protein [Alphaproteobacteria bacterium]MBU2096873.1 hypothetical protein [Alphaproteobacteria bacterium]MBU2153500.1 hypothetical protein [Alphaproteobacteria bacterium]MBU2305995.1 hypothetical protein [Alphaproteobacteria bacterium]